MTTSNGVNILNKKNVLVTGGTGFIGSWLVKELMDFGARVVVLDIKTSCPILDGLQRKPVLIKGSIQSLNLVRKTIEDYKIDFVFHLAAQAIVGKANKNPYPTLKTNIMGTLNILESCRQHKKVKGIVVASSDKAYGANRFIPYTESTPLRGLHPYDFSKTLTDLISQMYFKSYGLPVCIVRSANVFGGGDLNFSRLIPDTIRSVFLNKSPIIRSDGKFTRDYLYIKDEVKGYLILAESLLRDKKIAGEAFNLGTQNPHSVIDVVKTIISLMNKDLNPVILNKAKSEIKDQSLDSKKAKKVFGWKPQYSFKEGLEETVKWYIHHFKHDKKNSKRA